MPVVLVASSDDYLLGEAAADAAAELSRDLGGAPIESLADDADVREVATEVRSPSLFDPRRVLLVPGARRWVDATAPAGAGKAATQDPEPLAEAVRAGVGDALGLVLSAWVGRRPKGELVDAVEATGELRWLPLPAAPKPWDEAAVSDEQAVVLRDVVRRAAPDARFERAAETMLFERLGFDPRRLAAEARTLASAASGEPVDEELVRRLVFPRQRSLEALDDAILDREPGPIGEIAAVLAAGESVRDWRGTTVDPGGAPLVLTNLGWRAFLQLFHVRRAAARAGVVEEIDPARTSDRWWYRSSFKPRIAGPLAAAVADDPAAPFRTAPSPWRLHLLARGAGRYTDDELVGALARGGDVERLVRGAMGLEVAVAWLVDTVRRR